MFKRKNIADLLKTQPRDLRRFEAVLFKEYASNNRTFEFCLLYQGAKHWNALPVKERKEISYAFYAPQKAQTDISLVNKRIT